MIEMCKECVYGIKMVKEITECGLHENQDDRPTCERTPRPAVCKFKAKTVDDLISRQDAIAAYCEHECGKGMTREKCDADCGTIFDDIQSAQQEPVLDKIRAEINEYGSIMVSYAITEDAKTDKGIEKLVGDVLKQAKERVLNIIDKYKAESEVHCIYTDEEIARSFIEDVEAVKDLLPKAESEE